MKFMAYRNQRGYKKVLVDEGNTVYVDKAPPQTAFVMSEHNSSVQDDAVMKFGKLNVLAYKDIFCPLIPRLLLERLHSIFKVWT